MVRTHELSGQAEDAQADALNEISKALTEPFIFHCPRCASRLSYELKDRRRRCKSCSYTFHPFHGRWFGLLKHSPQTWLAILRWFENGATAESLAQRLGFCERTSRKTLAAIRLALFAQTSGAQSYIQAPGVLADYCCKGTITDIHERLELCRNPVFILDNSSGAYRMSIHPKLSASKFLALPLQKGVLGNVVVSQGFEEGGALFSSCRNLARSLFGCEENGNLNFLEAHKEFALSLRGLICSHRCYVPEKFPLFLAEHVFRFNRRGRHLLPDLIRAMCEPVSCPG